MMDAALQRRIQRYGWDKAANFYEDAWQQQLKPAQDLLLDIADIREGEKILDIACGTGLVSFRAAALAGKSGSVVATDISDKMVAIATSLATENGIENISFRQMDAEKLDFADNNFDIVLCALGFMYVPDVSKALEEMLRVLKPGGKAVAAVWGSRENCGWSEIFPIVDKRVASEVCPMFFNLGSGKMLDLHFSKAGFENVKSEKIKTSLKYHNEEEACTAMFEGGPVALAYFKFSQETKNEARAEYLSSIAEWKSHEGFNVPGEFVVTIGEKP